jgi:hypothetical protein
MYQKTSCESSSLAPVVELKMMVSPQETLQSSVKKRKESTDNHKVSYHDRTVFTRDQKGERQRIMENRANTQTRR